jgi:YHS domain-containing protein
MDSPILSLLVWGGLAFLMFRFGCGSHLFNRGQDGHAAHGRGGCCGDGHERHAKTDQAGSRVTSGPEDDGSFGTAKVRDPVCGEWVTPRKGKPTVHDGRVYHLCSRECRELFEVDPSLYVAEDGTPKKIQQQALLPAGPDASDDRTV